VNHLKDKVRILVTHQIQFLRKATQILVLNEGKCMALGTFEELQKSGIDFMTLLNENKEHESPETIRSRAKTELVVPNFVNETKLRTKSELLSVPEDESKARSRSLSIGAVESFEMPEVLMTSFQFQLNCEYNLFIYLFFKDFR
jgi:ABC-type multidrug transport system ATPase subunit